MKMNSNKVLKNLSNVLFKPIDFYIININITESEELQVKSLEKQLQLVV